MDIKGERGREKALQNTHMPKSTKIVIIVSVVILAAILGSVYFWKNRQPAPSIQITSPQSGATVITGSLQTIQWESKDTTSTDKISITIRRIPPPPLQTEGQEFDPIIFIGLPNTGSKEWVVSDRYPPGTYVLGVTAHDSVPVTNPLFAESAPFTIVPPLAQDLLPLYGQSSWSAPRLFPLELPQRVLYGTGIETEAETGTIDPASAFVPFDAYYAKKLKALGWKVDISLQANGPASGQTIYRKGDGFIAVNFYTIFHVRSDVTPSRCPCDVKLVLFSTTEKSATTATETEKGALVGGDSDAHGCIGSAGYSWCGARGECVRPWEAYCTATAPKKVTFSCDEAKTIGASFYVGDDKFVDLELSDGRKLSVPRAMSASGARYANADESFVFWNKGDTAFVTEGAASETTFANCILNAE